MKLTIMVIALLLSGCACAPTGEDAAWAAAMAVVHDPVTGAADLLLSSCEPKKDD